MAHLSHDALVIHFWPRGIHAYSAYCGYDADYATEAWAWSWSGAGAEAGVGSGPVQNLSYSGSVSDIRACPGAWPVIAGGDASAVPFPSMAPSGALLAEDVVQVTEDAVTLSLAQAGFACDHIVVDDALFRFVKQFLLDEPFQVCLNWLRWF